MRMIIVATLLMLVLLCSAAYARLPEVGDKVVITTESKQDTGTITDISDSFICIQITGTDGKIHDQCIGIGAITFLYWVDE